MVVLGPAPGALYAHTGPVQFQIELGSGGKEGLGEIQIEFSATLPRGGPNRRLVLENRHQRRIAAYLVNCLVPRDPDIRIVAQDRNEQQSVYRLDYVQAGGGSIVLEFNRARMSTGVGTVAADASPDATL
jgi:hypothetical protein